jgi:hypothetical protein
MATICDATIRKIACDIPSQASLHYSGKALGPLYPFGFDLGNFAEESEYLNFTTPENAATRSQVLDYFHQVKQVVPPDHLMFRFDKGCECSVADKLFMDQLCLQMGFQRSYETYYMTGSNRAVLDLYPEIGYFRDLVFFFNLVMVPTSDRLPELKPWDPHEAELHWSVSSDGNSYSVAGFGGKKLDCTQEFVSTAKSRSTRGLFSRFLKFVGISSTPPRASPSQANPSILLGAQVDTEDDILHVRNLPDFDGTLGAKDCELMLQYLTAPYMRIPTLLNFFSLDVRLRALRNVDLQNVLDAAIFEPGQWKEASHIEIPTEIPAPDRSHLCTPVGFLFNEIIMCPNVILESITSMLLKVIEMDTGKYSESSDAILYVVRLAVRVEGYLLFLVNNRKYHETSKTSTNAYGSYYEAFVRGLQCNQATIDEALASQKSLRDLLNNKVFRIIARWIRAAKNEGSISQACMLHAHLAFLYRNIDESNMDTRDVFTLLASQIFLFNNYKHDLDMKDRDVRKSRSETESYSSGLMIPEVELFDMYQRNRNKIVKWLAANQDLRDAVMDGILRLVEGEKDDEKEGLAHVSQPWVSLQQEGFSFVGRYVPVNEIDRQRLDIQFSVAGKRSFEEWLRDTSTLIANTEINVQLGEFTIKKNVIQPLPKEIVAFDEFKSVFQTVSTDDIIQCATVKVTTNRHWLRLVGLGYDLQCWSPDIRKPVSPYKKSYDSCSVAWLKAIIEPWREKALSQLTIFMSSLSM